jgi:2-methylaconitate cis-trans-isomerase PrpF
VGDLYNAFLRRGGDSGGVQFWIDQLDSGAQTRDQVRSAFLGSPEFSNRVNNVVQQGCSP